MAMEFRIAVTIATILRMRDKKMLMPMVRVMHVTRRITDLFVSLEE